MIPLKDDIPTRRFPVMTVVFIALNVAIFLFQLASGLPRSVGWLGMVPKEVLSGRDAAPLALVPPVLTVVTSMFAHGGVMHLVGNMLFLWIFGNNVEDDVGRVKFVLFYFLVGGAAAGAQIAVSADSTIPMVGASGAVAGILGAYLLLYPHARVLTLVPIFVFIRLIWIPAVVFLVLWFVAQVFGLFGSEAGGVAFWAHIGGFVAGVALIKPFAGRIWRTDEEGGWKKAAARSPGVSVRGPWRNF